MSLGCFIVAPQDEIRDAGRAVARAAYDQLGGQKQWLDIDGGHFGLLYVPSPEFDFASSAQARFLSQHL
ncbi:MAG TPA: hypothetical protein VFG86_27310 [Chloroflexota bacterium]|nr:hypothetical protein [Chloroflexota bacterium]